MLTNILADLAAMALWEIGKISIDVYKEIKEEKEKEVNLQETSNML
jgi:hypothetical protein